MIIVFEIMNVDINLFALTLLSCNCDYHRWIPLVVICAKNIRWISFGRYKITNTRKNRADNDDDNGKKKVCGTFKYCGVVRLWFYWKHLRFMVKIRTGINIIAFVHVLSKAPFWNLLSTVSTRWLLRYVEFFFLLLGCFYSASSTNNPFFKKPAIMSRNSFGLHCPIYLQNIYVLPFAQQIEH